MSSLLDWRAWWLSLRLHGLVLPILLLACGFVTVGSILLASETETVRAAFETCMRSVPEGSDACRPEAAPLNDLSMWHSMLQYAAQFSPIILGLFLGVPIVAREIEGGTAQIAWSLDGGRARWFAQMVVPLLTVVAVVGIAVGFGGERLAETSPFGEHALGIGFNDIGSRLGQVPIRAVAVTILGIAIGAVMARQLPAMLVTAVIAALLFVPLSSGMRAWMLATPEVISYRGGFESGALLDTQKFRVNATGALVSTDAWDSEQQLDPDVLAPPGMTRVWIGVPGARYGDWVLRESAVVLGAAAVGLAGTLFLIRRRRAA